MKTPICNFCLRSGILCSKCQEEVRLGKINDLDIRIAKNLLQMEKDYPALQKTSFYRAYEADDTIAIVVGSGNLPIFMRDSRKIIKDLQKKIGKNVKVLEKGGNIRKFLEDLFTPMSITAINTIWLPDGSTETRAILPSRPRRLPMSVKTLKILAKNIQGMILRVEFQELNNAPLNSKMRRRGYPRRLPPYGKDSW